MTMGEQKRSAFQWLMLLSVFAVATCGLIYELIAGTLADFVLEPGMRSSGDLVPMFGWLVPPGPGAGMGLLIFFSALGGILAG